METTFTPAGACAHTRFEWQARRHPHRPAVVSGTTRLTYAELDRLANGLAHRLAAIGVRPGALVGVCVERDEWLLVALLGVLKAGAGYVPLDPASPPERNHYLTNDAGLSVVVTGHLVRDIQPAGPLSTEIAPHDPAYVIYTSGTTGAPKGVLVEHRNLANLLDWATHAFDEQELRGVLAASSVCFDAAILEIFIPLAAGGTVVLADNLLALPTLPARDEVTLLFGVPSVLAALLRDPLPPGVRTVLTGGEAVNRGLCDRLYANPGVHRVVNLYGPTETTVICAGADVDRDGSGPPPIGRAIAGAELSVRDPDGDETAEGELWVAGPVVARGYLGRPDFGPDGYRTGDLVRRRGDDLYFVGRADDQVKVRGHRIEPGEVAAALTSHPDVRHAVAGAIDDRLVAHVEADGVQESELRTWLRARLPAYLVPSRIGVLARMPVTTSGKVDRAALPDLPARRDPALAFTVPEEGIEQLIAGIVADVLGLPEVGAHDRFADLGGHSLAAARVVGELSRTLGTTVPPAVFLRHPTVAGLAAALADVPAETPLRHVERDSYPLTATQREFWLLRQLAPASPATTVAVAIGVTGPVTAAAVSAALTAITARHEVLRGQIVVRDGEPEMVVAPVTPVPVDEVDGPSVESHRTAAGHVFDLAVAPLVRATLIRTADTTAELVVVLDHIAFDGSSVAPLLTELAAELAGEPVAPVPIQVGDIALHDQTGIHAEFWRAELAGAAIPDDLPGRDAPPGHRSERLTIPLDRALVDRVADLAAASAATPFAVYLAALGLVIGGFTNRADLVIGVPAARRHRPGTERLIGPLVDVLPLRVRLAARSFRALVKECAERTTAALAHQELPAAALLPAHRHPGASRTPVLLSMQPLDEPVTVRRGEFRLDLHTDLGSGGSPNELTVFVARTAAGVQLQVEYAVNRFTAADADRLASRLLATLTAGLSTPDSALPALADHDELAAARSLADGPPVPPGPATVVAAVLAQAAERPAAIAVSGTGGDLTYADLATLSERIAVGLVAAGVRPGDVVGVCLPRDRELPAALLAVGRAGAVCLPMDPTHPVDRLAWLAADAGAATVLVADRRLPSVSTVDITRLGTPKSANLPGVTGTDLAYLLHTSGSTGTPKAVAVTHANLAAAIAGMLAGPGVGPHDVMLALAPLSFDVAAGEIWTPLCAGGRCVVAERSVATDGFALAELISSAGITMLDVTPTTLRMLLAAGWPRTPDLRVLTGGETLDPGLARQVLPRVAALWNCYGPTETTITSTAHDVTEVAGDVPIGRPLPGERCYVVDPLGRLVPPGVPGELWIGGAGVARGYHGRPELTEAAFVPDPVRPGERCYRTGDVVRWRADGALEFLGRRDDQVKVRGYRIELGEVTAALRAVPGVADAAVTTAGTAGDTHLVGYLTPTGLDTDAVRAALRGRLPDHMVPRRWVLLPALPVLPNGKVDRAALPDPPREDRPRVDPNGDAELLVAEVWAAVLDRPQVFAGDDFFALGGHSFAATRVVGRLREALAIAVPVQLLFDRPVLADFAAELTRLLLDDLLDQSQGTGA